MALEGGIADLSYRLYQGPKRKRPGFIIIAERIIRAGLKKKGFWAFSFVSGWFYGLLIGLSYFFQQTLANAEETPGPGLGQAASGFLDGIIWGDAFVSAIGVSQTMWMLMALLVGAGVIAADNRANALPIYLSRPITKRDYIFGKWLGLFTLLIIGFSLPSLIFLLYGALNLGDYGFLTDDPLMIPKLILTLVSAAALHTSVLVGVSSLFKGPRMAGGLYAGIYFLTTFFSGIIGAVRLSLEDAPRNVQEFAELASYWSIDGLIKGASRAIFQSPGQALFGIGERGRVILSPIPPVGFQIFLLVAVAAVGIFITWRRVSAVEVVK